MTKITRSAFLRSMVLGLCTAGLLVACGGGSGGGSSSSGDSGGSWSVGTEPAFPPFESTNNGKLEGFDIDLLNAIGAKAGKTINFQSLPFDGLIPALQGGTINAAVSAMTITDERAKTVDFSDPYIESGLAIAVAKKTTDIQSLDDLKGKKIAVQIGTTGADAASKVPDAKVSSFDSAPLALQELVNGNVDAVINDAPVTKYAISTGNIPGVMVVGKQLTSESYGIALPKGSKDVETVNKALSEIKADGTYDTIYKKWFGETPPK